MLYTNIRMPYYELVGELTVISRCTHVFHPLFNPEKKIII